MIRRIGFVLVVLIALPIAAQHSSRRRAVPAPKVEVITILQTTDIHDHANGASHVGLDVNPTTATSLIGAYSRIATYVGTVRASASNPVILVDSGDWTMGTLYDLTLGSRPLALGFIGIMH